MFCGFKVKRLGLNIPKSGEKSEVLIYFDGFVNKLLTRRSSVQVPDQAFFLA